MKILDVGSSCGYVGAWLKAALHRNGDDSARGILRYIDAVEGSPVEIDALDLSEDAVAAARSRGINARLGRAEDAPYLLEPESYDAVVAFELIEHVEDVERFLTACEAMLRPGGRVYLSTPDTTFGEGGNPNHLRCYRSIDLFDLVRRRGRVHDCEVGHDRIVAASYSPGPRRGEIAIFCGPALMPWHPSDIEAKGLGGSETAAIRLAEHLSCLGFVVTVYGEIADQGVWKDVIVRHWSVYDPLEPRLATVASRMPEIFDRPVASRSRVLWLHDVDAGDRLTPRRAERIDAILVLSEWHRRHVAGRYPFAADKLVVTRNGIEHAYFGGTV